MSKIIVAASLSSLLIAGTLQAGTITYADPGAAGISYEWTVSLSDKDAADLVRHVGAKSWYEAPPGYAAPDVGWTHTSDWIAVELTKPAKLTITVDRQQGVTNSALVNGSLVTSVTGDKLYPAFSVYAGWDDTSAEDHRYNPVSNIAWSTVSYVTHEDNLKGKSSVSKTIRLPAGKYSIAIGGKNYFYCAATDPCYGGRHGYEVHLKTSK